MILKIEAKFQDDEIEIIPYLVKDTIEMKSYPVYKKLLDNYYFMFINSTNDVKATINLRNRKGIFTKILEKILDSSIKNELITSIENINNNLNKNASIKDFNDILEIKLKKLFEYDTSGTSIKPLVQFGLSSKEKLLYNFQILLKQNTKEFHPTEIGDGLKNIFINTLFQIYLENEYKLNNNSFLIIIDEPEIHLHPHSQRYLITHWMNTIKKIIGSNPENYQLIVSTHSSNVPFPTEDSNYLFYQNVLNNTTLVKSKSIQQYHDKKLKKWILNTLQMFPECIFAKTIIFIEGKSDWWYIKYLSLILNKYNLDSKGISLRYVNSCNELENAVETNKFFEKRIKVILDDDKGKNIDIEKRLKLKGIDVFKVVPAIETIIINSLTPTSLIKITMEIESDKGQFKKANDYLNKIYSKYNKNYIKSTKRIDEIVSNWDMKTEKEKKDIIENLKSNLIKILSKNKTEYMCFIVGDNLIEDDITAEIKSILEFICKK